MSQSYLLVDSAVILAAGFVFGWKEALYALITLYVSGLVAETTAEGRGIVRTAFIVTSQPRAPFRVGARRGRLLVSDVLFSRTRFRAWREIRLPGAR